MKIEGTVDSIYTKEVHTKRGPASVFHAMINGQDINLGFKKTVEEGEYVVLNVEEKYGSWQVSSKGTPTSAGKSAGYAKPSGSLPAPAGRGPIKSFPIPDTDHAISICRQNALTNANATVASYFSTLKSTTHTLDDVADMVLRVAIKYVGYTTGAIDRAIAEGEDE